MVGAPHFVWSVNQTMRYLSRLTGPASIIDSFSKRVVIGAGMIALLVVLGCGGNEQQEQTPISEPAPTAASASASSATSNGIQSSSESAIPVLDAGSTVIIIQDGTTARYIVGEQLARVSVPRDAVGETRDVTGTIVFNEDGSVLPEASVITVGVNGLRSDESRRDGYLSRNSIQTSRFPDATFAINGTEGLVWPLPSEGIVSFTLLGDMTIRDVTRPVTLDVDAEFTGDSFIAIASTIITFDQFDMSKPRLAFILSVEDEIRLELDILASIQTGR